MSPPVVLGLDFGGSKMAAAVADADGEQLGHVRTAVDPSASAVATFERGVDAARRLLIDVAPDRLLAAVGACTFGIPHLDRVELAPNVAGWDAIAFGARLQAAFPGAAVRISTDVKAAAQAELDGGALAGFDPGLYLNLGTGLAAALVVGGSVVAGRHRAAGEIGYSLRAPDLDGCAEDVVSGKALEAAALRLVGRRDVGALIERRHTDAAAARVCAEFVRELSFHVVNLTISLDPQRVVIGGGLVRSWEFFAPALSAAIAAAVPFPPEIVRAVHPFDAPLRGALALGRSALPDFSPVDDVLSEGAPA